MVAPSALCEVLTRHGSLFDPNYPAAMGIYYELSIRLHDLILRDIAEHMPEVCPVVGSPLSAVHYLEASIPILAGLMQLLSLNWVVGEVPRELMATQGNLAGSTAKHTTVQLRWPKLAMG